MNFTELGLNEQLLQAVADLGFETPTEIQEKAIPVLLGKDTDFVGLAQTGTGKTCAYGLPLLARIAPEDRRPQGVILCPTRELCMQIVLDMRQFAAHLKGINIVPVYGGASINTQVNQLRRGAHVVVATPGRLLDMMSRGVVDLGAVSIFILDEADEMLDMGFQEDIDQVFHAIPEEHLTWMFSATMGREVQSIAESYLNDPVEVTVGTRNQTADNITHDCYIVKPEHRYHSLRRLLDMIPDMYALIFRRTRVETQELADMLSRDGYAVEALHGDLSQAQRDNVMGRFRRKQLKILIATDVAARGLDVDDITHVIHYDLPDDLEIYTHRSGRTARAGKQGCSIVFVSPAERYRLGQLERRLHIHFNAKLVPDGIDVCRQRLTRLAATIKDNVIDDERIAKFYPDVIEAFETVTREDLIKGLLARELKNIKGEHVSHQDLNAGGKKRFEKRDDRRAAREERREARDDDRRGRRDDVRDERGPRPAPKREERRDRRTEGREGPEEGMRIFEINVGRADHINPGAIVRLVCDNTGIQSRQIGHITLGEETSFFQVDENVAGLVRDKVPGADLDGQPVDLREAETMPARGDRPPRPKNGGPRRFDGHFGGGRPGGHYGGGRPPYRKYDRRYDRN